MNEVTRLFDVPYYAQKISPLKEMIGHRLSNGQLKYWSTDEFIATANKISLGLLELGVKKGDKIALISYNNRPEWCMVDIGAQQIGAITVPVYPTIAPKDYQYIFNESEVKYCFVGMCGKGDLLQKITEANAQTLQKTFSFERVEGAPCWEDVFREGDLSEVEAIKKTIDPHDLATIIYTSGTTGNPKGVMLTHDNVLSNIRDVIPQLPFYRAGLSALSFLPLCHIFERTVTYSYFIKGVKVTQTGTANLGGDDGDLRAIKPHFFTTVPRLLEKVYEKIYNKGLTLEGFKKKLFFWALNLTDSYEYDKKFGFFEGIKNSIADKLIFSKWREALGGNVIAIVTGAAACPMKMAKVFSAAGVPIREGYGLTETSPVLTVNGIDKGQALLGSVGRILPSVTIKIDPSDGNYKEGEGEILAQGPNVMQGYYKQPEKTRAVLANGWFYTGDIGKLIKDKNGTEFLKITGRKKALLKTSGGKYVAPEPIEKRFKEPFLVETMMVVGEGMKFVSGLIVPGAAALKEWCGQNGVPCTLSPKPDNPEQQCVSPETLKDPKVIAEFQRIVDELNPEFSHIEQIKKFTLLPIPWDVATGELTPTMKIKRSVVRELYKKEIDEIYNV